LTHPTTPPNLCSHIRLRSRSVRSRVGDALLLVAVRVELRVRRAQLGTQAIALAPTHARDHALCTIINHAHTIHASPECVSGEVSVRSNTRRRLLQCDELRLHLRPQHNE
jgi:hypothetical protein